MRRLALVGLVLVLALSLSVTATVVAQTGTTQTGKTPPSSKCLVVSGAFMVNTVDAVTGVAAVTGDLRGAVRGKIIESGPSDNGSLKLRLEHAFTTEAGDALFTSDESTLLPIKDNIFYQTVKYTIKGGTNKFANANGTLASSGIFDAHTGQAILRYSGEICTTRGS
jgi:hypothetical protein